MGENNVEVFKRPFRLSMSLSVGLRNVIRDAGLYRHSHTTTYAVCYMILQGLDSGYLSTHLPGKLPGSL